MPDKIETENSECNKSFTKINNVLHVLHIYHLVFTAVIWIVIILLLIDYYNHILPHSSHEGILWFEFISYTLFLLVPGIITGYKHYKCKNN